LAYTPKALLTIKFVAQISGLEGAFAPIAPLATRLYANALYPAQAIQ